MADQNEIKTFERLALAIGPSAALLICAFWAYRSLYVPTTLPAEHILRRLIGNEAAEYLVAQFGGECLSIPGCELRPVRRAGQLHALSPYGVSDRAAALAIGITPRRVEQLRAELQREGYDFLAAGLEICDGQ
jgi:hypothetical protein